MKYALIPNTEWSNALAYMSNYLEGRLLYEHLPPSALKDDCLSLEVVCSQGLPQRQDYRYGWGANASVATDWLVTEIAAYLNAHNNNLGIIEDPGGERADARITQGATGPAWFYGDRVLWPITQAMANADLVRKALEWADVGIPQIIAFAKVRRSFQDLTKGLEVSEDILWEIGTSITCL